MDASGIVKELSKEETVRITKEINELNKQIADNVEKQAEAGEKARQQLRDEIGDLREKKKLKEKLLSTDDKLLGTLDKAATLSYDVKDAQQKLIDLKEVESAMSKEDLKKNQKKIDMQRQILTSNVKMASSVQARQRIEQKILGGLYMSKAAMLGMVAAAKAMTMVLLKNPLLLIAAALAVAVKLMISFIGYTQRLSSELGVTAKQAQDMAFQFKVAQIEGKILGYDAMQTGKALADNFGTIESVSVANIRALGQMQASLGITTDTSAALAKNFEAFAGDSIGGATKRMERFGAMALSNGVLVSAVMNDIASNTEVFAEFARDGGDNVARAAIQAKKLGLSIADTAKMASSLLDFESSIEKEMEASLMIGKQLNFNKARQLALEGDIAGAAQSVIDQVGGREAFQNMNVLQRRSVAAAAGVDVSTLMKMMGGRDKMTVKDTTTAATQEVNKSVGITNQLIGKIGPLISKGVQLAERAYNWMAENGGKVYDFLVNNWGKVIFGLIALQAGIRALPMLLAPLISKAFGGIFSKMGKLFGFGSKVPLTKSGRPDMRFKVNKNLAKEGVEGAGKGIAKKLGAKGLGVGLKKIPIIGALAGLGFAGMRAMKGDFTGAGLELASGAASTIPGVGTAASIGLDTVILARDIARAGDASEEANAVNEAMLEQEKQAQQQQMEAQRQAGVKADETNAMMLNYGEQQNFLLQDIYNNISTLNDSVKNLRDE